MKTQEQPWIYSKWVDSIFVLLPPFAVLLIIVILQYYRVDLNAVSPAAWIILVLGIDVSHVYSTLYRTYFDAGARMKYKSVFLFVPVGCLIAGVLLHSIHPMLFWRCLAYLAVFHFIRQQYGFLRLYSRKEVLSVWKKRLDAIAIYSAMLYPMIYWHFAGDRQFTWFIEGDFLLSDRMDWILIVSFVLYVVIIVFFAWSEIYVTIKNRFINIPKILVLLGTALSWYFGIVHYNGDLTFTALNVIAHGIPYMALVWMYGKKQVIKSGDHSGWKKIVFKPQAFLIYLTPLLLLAFLEEGLWDALIWRDHSEYFQGFYFLPSLLDKSWISLLVPLLSLPQMTHYVLDGFIWKVSRSDVKAEMGI
jgi:hypothetical protein